jgi:plasmid stabilization system protein ParE
MLKPVLSAEARRDLKSIQDYIADEQERPQTALKVIEQILDRIENLLSFPDSGTLLSPQVSFPTNYRYARAAGYLIFYRHENNQIFVDRIIHRKRNYITVLFPVNENEDEITTKPVKKSRLSEIVNNINDQNIHESE